MLLWSQVHPRAPLYLCHVLECPCICCYGLKCTLEHPCICCHYLSAYQSTRVYPFLRIIQWANGPCQLSGIQLLLVTLADKPFSCSTALLSIVCPLTGKGGFSSSDTRPVGVYREIAAQGVGLLDSPPCLIHPP
jgi:hypothetical protein